MSYYLLCFSFILPLCFAQDLSCVWTDPAGGKTYDLSKLKNTAIDYYIPKNTYPQQDWDIWINVCHGLVTSLCGGDVIACQQWDKTSPQGHAAMGVATTQKFEKNALGVVLQYINGPDSRQTEIDFICDAAAGIGKPQYVIENPQHHYTFSWNTQYACPVTVGAGGISPGSIILIILVCLIVIYLVAGLIFNKFKRGLNGIELIPNVTFWTSIPGLVKDGVMFIVNKVRNRGGYTKM